MSDKPRVIKDFEKLEVAIQDQIKLSYPYGFEQHLITFYDKEGKKVMALPFETDDRYYMVRMTLVRAQEIIEEDEDYDDDGILKSNIKEDLIAKYGEMDDVSEFGEEDTGEEEVDPYGDTEAGSEEDDDDDDH